MGDQHGTPALVQTEHLGDAVESGARAVREESVALGAGATNAANPPRAERSPAVPLDIACLSTDLELQGQQAGDAPSATPVAVVTEDGDKGSGEDKSDNDAPPTADEAQKESRLATLFARCFGPCLAPAVFEVAVITIANGGDNIGVYLPLFATGSAAVVVTTLVIFYVMLAAWCGAAFAMVRCPFVADGLSEYGEYVVPFLLVGLGLYILWDSVLFQPS